MMINILADFLVGLVPFLGDLADAAFKCNTRNLRLLEETLDKKYKPQGADERDQAGIDKEKRRKNRESGIFHHNDPPPATAFEDFSDDEYRDMDHHVQQPAQAHHGPPRDIRQQQQPPRQETGSVRR